MPRRPRVPKRAANPVGPAQPRPPLQFFTADEADLVEAITARLVPVDDSGPGAREAGALIYIDRAVAGYFSSLQVFYREGFAAIDALAQRRHRKAFTALGEAEQDTILRAIETPQGPDGSERLAQFFAVIHEHTIEGMFGDPVYGGNRDFVGWRMIGFPGAQPGYTPEQMLAGPKLHAIPMRGLADIQGSSPAAKGPPRS